VPVLVPQSSLVWGVERVESQLEEFEQPGKVAKNAGESNTSATAPRFFEGFMCGPV
jgi:hypothetical protein